MHIYGLIGSTLGKEEASKRSNRQEAKTWQVQASSF